MKNNRDAISIEMLMNDSRLNINVEMVQLLTFLISTVRRFPIDKIPMNQDRTISNVTIELSL